MKIDWKHLATTPGYRSLKAAYIHDVKAASKDSNPMRKKPEFLKLFNWVISRAKHYSQVQQRPIEEVLNEWEAARDYWWLNYYQDGKQRKFHSKSRKTPGLRSTRKYLRKWARFNHEPINNRMCREIQRIQRANSTKAKARWSSAHKLRAREMRAYKKNL